MTKIDVDKIELIWPGKFDEHGKLKDVQKLNLPFQIIERVNETQTTRDVNQGGKQKTLYDFWNVKEEETFDKGWKNKLIWGDNKIVMSSLLEKFAGKITLIYIDPPFATGADFTFTPQIGESDEIQIQNNILLSKKRFIGYVGKWNRILSIDDV